MTFFNAYRQRRYAEALEIVQTINLPEYVPTHYTAAMTHAQLGNMPAARATTERPLQLWPNFERDFLTDHLEKWVRNQPDLIAHIVEGLRLSGFRIQGGEAPGGGAPTAVP